MTSVTSYVKPQFPRKDPARRASYAADPLITPPISVNMLLGLHDTGARIMADAGIRTPTQTRGGSSPSRSPGGSRHEHW